MKEKILSNWRLKIFSVFLAVLSWIVIINISDPIKPKKITLDVEILNGDQLEENGLTYEIKGSTVIEVTVRARATVHNSITSSDFKATADLRELWVNGTIPIQIKIINNNGIIEDVVSSKTTLQVATEEIQTKEFHLAAAVTGKPAEGYVVGGKNVTPGSIHIKGPVSLIGRINSVGIEVGVDGVTEDCKGNAKPILYDANGNQLDGISSKLQFDREEVGYTIDILKAKEVKLNFEVTGKPADGYRYVRIEASAQSIFVAGAPDIISSMESITLSEDILNINGAVSNVTNVIDINKYLPPGVSLTHSAGTEVTVTAKIEQLKQKTFQLRQSMVEIRNKESGFDYETADINGIINVTIEGLASELDTLTESALGAFTDAAAHGAGSYELPIKFELGENFRVVTQIKLPITIKSEGEESSETLAPTAPSTTAPTTTAAPTVSSADGTAASSAEHADTAGATVESTSVSTAH